MTRALGIETGNPIMTFDFLIVGGLYSVTEVRFRLDRGRRRMGVY